MAAAVTLMPSLRWHHGCFCGVAYDKKAAGKVSGASINKQDSGENQLNVVQCPVDDLYAVLLHETIHKSCYLFDWLIICMPFHTHDKDVFRSQPRSSVSLTPWITKSPCISLSGLRHRHIKKCCFHNSVFYRVHSSAARRAIHSTQLEERQTVKETHRVDARWEIEDEECAIKPLPGRSR